MPYLIFSLTTLALLGGFLILTEYETKRGVRLYQPLRARLDQSAERAEFIIKHVNLGAFMRSETRDLAHRIGHDLVHLSLVVVRSVERTLTRLIRYFHTRQAATTAPRESTRAFVKTLSDFKEHLKTTSPDMPEIQ